VAPLQEEGGQASPSHHGCRLHGGMRGVEHMASKECQSLPSDDFTSFHIGRFHMGKARALEQPRVSGQVDVRAGVISLHRSGFTSE
jgi:hypothetical protein